MFTSIQKLPRRALPVLSAIVFLSFAGNPSAAQTPAEFASRPARAIERITPEATTVVSTAHYHAVLALACNGAGGLCTGDFPVVGGRRRLNLTRISCHMHSSNYAPFGYGRIVVRPADAGTGTMAQYLPADHTNDWGYHVLNRAIDVRVATRQYITVFLNLASGQAFDGECTVQGTLETLQ